MQLRAFVPLSLNFDNFVTFWIAIINYSQNIGTT